QNPSLKEPPFNPRIPSQLATTEDIFSIIRKGDLLLHRPFESYTAIVEFVQSAANDPDVVAIKQTLYRTDTGSPIIEALANAATPRRYADIDLMTTDEAFGEEASQFMNLLTGYSIATVQEIFENNAPGWEWKRFVVAPVNYHQWTLRMIERETRNARDGKPS